MLNDDILKLRLLTRRAFISGLGKLSLLSVLAGRLYYLQVMKAPEYKTLSDKNSIKLFLDPSPRGLILDRAGNYLAINENNYNLTFDKSYTDKPLVTINNLFNILGIDEDERNKFIKKYQQNPSGPVLFDYALTWEEVVRIESNSYDLPGVGINVGPLRYYPYGSLCAHVVGYIGQPTEEELKTLAVANHPGMKIGKIGIEKALDRQLSGEPGIRKMEVNAFGLVIREISKKEALGGKELNLTIDIELQDFVSKNVNQEGTAAVVIDIHSGEILAMYSSPSFDPNLFAHKIPQAYWSELINNVNTPLINKTIGRTFPPGSIFKMMVAFAALREGISENFVVFCPGYIQLGNRKFHCSKEGGHGDLNMTQAICYSCNTYFFTLAKKIGIDKIHDMAAEFGFGQKLGIELPAEVAGILPSKRWKKKKYGKEWQVGDSLNASIGQGFVQATPLQLAVMTARIANGGKKIVPRLTILENNARQEEWIDLPAKYFDIVRKGMEQVVNMPGGTAYMHRIENEMMQMAGKTGTSQVISKINSDQDLSNENIAREFRNHGLFVGYAPINNPKYACAVVVEHGGGGGRSAAPIVKRILEAAQK